MRKNIVDYSPSVKAQSDHRTGTTTSVSPVGILYMHTFWFGLVWFKNLFKERKGGFPFSAI